MARQFGLLSMGVAFALLLSCCAGHAHAHGVTITSRVQAEEGIVVVQCRYSTGEPMAYAAITVHGPGYTEVEFQNGRTDALGRFAYLPKTPGTWSIQVDDGMGHRSEAAIEIGHMGNETVSSSMAASSGGRSGHADRSALGALHTLPLWLATLFGVSIIANVFMLIAQMQRRRM